MTTRHANFLAILLTSAALQPAVVRAQAAADPGCSYSQCALRVDHGFLSTRLVRGSSGERVSRLGWFGSGVGVLLAGSDSAAFYARQYRSRRTSSDALGIVSAGLLLGAIWTTESTVRSAPLLLGSAVLELVSLPLWLGSRRSLDRSVWWYNRDLPRP